MTFLTRLIVLIVNMSGTAIEASCVCVCVCLQAKWRTDIITYHILFFSFPADLMALLEIFNLNLQGLRQRQTN